MRRATRAIALSLCALFAAAGCSEPDLGELPALCAMGECPEGYDCINGVCARPGTPVPITVAELPFLRGVDLKVMPQASTVLVTWQTYAYSDAGQRFMGARVAADGRVSPEMTLVSSFLANTGATEPFYDVLLAPDGALILAVSAPPLDDDPQPEPRLMAYRVTLPVEGKEALGAQFQSPWAGEMRMSTIGFGAVSRPKLIERDGHIELGYVRTRTALSEMGSALETIGELAVVKLDHDGAPLPFDPSYFRARDGLPVAVGVASVLRADTGVFWVLDDARPSALLIDNAGETIEHKLGRLAIAVSAGGSSLTYIRPSRRMGEKLPSDPVSGPAALHRVDHSIQGNMNELTDAELKDLPMPIVRDTPKPAWVPREDKPALLITPGAEEDAPSLIIYAVDTAAGSTSEVARIDRFASSPIKAVAASVVSGKLFVAWVDGEGQASIRMMILADP